MDTLEECRFIESTLSRISLEIETLLAEKARLRRRINTLRASTSILPAETLATVFEHTRWEYREKLRVGSVCSRWRNVLHTTPSLWTSVPLPYTRANGVDYLLYHHQRAKDLPLAVELLTARYTSREKITSLLRVLLMDISRNLRSLTFHSIDQVIWSVIESHGSTESNFPNLENLTLSFASGNTCRMKGEKILFSSSRLGTINLRFAMPGIEEVLPLENVTHIDAKNMISSPQGMRTLARCPKIVYFSWEVHLPYERMESGMVNSRASVIFPNLETLVWSGGDLTSAANLIRGFQFPSLRRLDWAESSASPRSFHYGECKRSFLSSMSDLRVLRSSLDEATVEMLRCFPSLEFLELTGCSNNTSPWDVFHNLVQELSWTGTNRLLPHLKNLTLFLFKITKPQLAAIIKMLESRRLGGLPDTCAPLGTFTLHVKSHDITPVWERGHISSLKKLVQGGMELVIWEDQRAPGRMLVL